MLYDLSLSLSFFPIKVGALFPPKIRSFKQRSWRPLAPWICQDMPRRTIFGRWVRSVGDESPGFCMLCVDVTHWNKSFFMMIVCYILSFFFEMQHYHLQNRYGLYEHFYKVQLLSSYKPWAPRHASPFFGASQPWFDALRLGMIFFHMLFLGGISTGLMTVASSILFAEGLEVCHFRWGKLATVRWEWISSSDLV